MTDIKDSRHSAVPTHPTIVVDIDGVLADFTHGFHSLFGDPDTLWSVGGQAQWDLGGGPVSASQVKQAWQEVNLRPKFWRDLQCIITKPEVAEFNDLVNRQGFDVWYVTARSNSAHIPTIEWLKAKGMPFWSQVIFTNDKVEAIEALAAGVPSLGAVVPFEREIVAVIDDSPDNLKALKDAGFPLYVRDWRYNRIFPAATNAGFMGWKRSEHNVPARVYSFGEFCHYLRDLAGHWRWLDERAKVERGV